MKKKRRIFPIVMSVLFAASLFITPAEAASFSDVYPSERAYTAIEEMTAREVISGFPDGTFRQNESVTRAQSAIFVGRMMNITPNTDIESTFTDISPNQKAYPYIAELTSQSIFSMNDRFYPDRPLTRAEMAIILVKAFNLQGAIDTPFSDVPDRLKAAPYIHALAASGITSGIGNNLYDPDGIVTRGQMAIFMSNIVQFQQPGTEPEAPTKPSYNIDPTFKSNATEQQIFLLVNQERINAGVNTLKLANDLSYVARVKSKDMRDHDYFDHTSPAYGSPFQMMKDFGLDYMSAGENIAAGQDTAVHVMNSWMNSPGHRQNILNPDFIEIGIGYVEGGDYGSYFTQMFMTR
ncbi:S-layer homology domain-containing protein [Domibacillus mangrovi]|uniref:SLH domain-containing protein n=1 Tax=Domibacillus mangrovi TaxID=1714354 RepID=A0A1Q5P5V6_9BACI|nr:S-layer homology domain-containing protein [Domibacillus mangrovi]OKL37649.1 hypothetical protein BLL40_04945 [Domibacillus mangrovi]